MMPWKTWNIQSRYEFHFHLISSKFLFIYTFCVLLEKSIPTEWQMNGWKESKKKTFRWFFFLSKQLQLPFTSTPIHMQWDTKHDKQPRAMWMEYFVSHLKFIMNVTLKAKTLNALYLFNLSTIIAIHFFFFFLSLEIIPSN